MSLASFNVECFYSFSLFFMTFLKNKVPLNPPFKNRTFLILYFSNVSMGLDWCYTYLAGVLYKWWSVLRVSQLEAYNVHLSFIGEVNFDHPVKMLSGFSAVYWLFFFFFPLGTNKQSVGHTPKSLQITALHQHAP